MGTLLCTSQAGDTGSDIDAGLGGGGSGYLVRWTLIVFLFGLDLLVPTSGKPFNPHRINRKVLYMPVQARGWLCQIP